MAIILPRALAFVGLLAVSCAPRPTEDLRQFSAAAETVRASAQPLLDDIATAERANRQRAITLAARSGGGDDCAGTWISGSNEDQGFASRFCVGDASYYADIGDPPVTATLRRGLDVVVGFATTLRQLMEGATAEAETLQIQRLAHEFGMLTAVVAGPFGPTSGAAAVSQLVGPVAGQLAPVITSLLRERDAHRARNLILANAEEVDHLIDALINGASQADRILSDRVALDLIRQRIPSSLIPAQVERINTYRRLLANYIVMLQRSRGLWQAVVNAAQAPAGLQAAPLAAQLAEIRADAEAFRRAYTIIRNPKP